MPQRELTVSAIGSLLSELHRERSHTNALSYNLLNSTADEVQPTWQAIKSAAKNVPGGQEVQLEDVQAMADLCPDVVILRNPQQ